MRAAGDKRAVAVADTFAKHAIFRYRERIDALPDDHVHARDGVRAKIMRADIDDMHAAFDPAAFDHRIQAVRAGRQNVGAEDRLPCARALDRARLWSLSRADFAALQIPLQRGDGVGVSLDNLFSRL